ncbi:hypothetical protein IRT45_32795 [Nocardia sp. BSTN01]|uniref:alpha/beta hydrolase n=1 Tax=Nocardia sp. BSTN01 TaxID=2783665 RepID=UPI00188DDCC1|nr:alpha/beta hydrolase [Nocardia sp. BSTN01]MBF5001904.1 hypothetical protein [Nocardia sp. BSTN01]
MEGYDPLKDPGDFLGIDGFHHSVILTHLRYQLEEALRTANESIAKDFYGEKSKLLLHAARHVYPDADNLGYRRIKDAWGAERLAGNSEIIYPKIGIPENPKQLHEHWSGLSMAEKDGLYRVDPFIGNRDGIPQLERDRYNRQTLDVLRAQAKKRGDTEALEGLGKIKGLLKPSDDGLPPSYLSYIDGESRFVYALDNPDTAKNVVIELLPASRGVEARVEYVKATVKQLRQAAISVDPNAETSVILWGAYKSPVTLPEALYYGPAERAAGGVRQYHEGLRITHQGPPSNNPTIGHSYGSVLGGHAAGHGNSLNTDNLVFVGSWGTGVKRVDDLRLTGVVPEDTSRHVFATLAKHDPVQLMPAIHEILPTHRGFHAINIGADSTPSKYWAGWNPEVHMTSHYYKSGSPSLRNIALIMTGHGNLVT